MNSEDDQENELRRREKELQARESAIRLRELESEINQPSLHQTVKYQESEHTLTQWSAKLVNVGKFLAIIIAVVVSIKIATSLAAVIIVGAVAWVGYKIFWESENSKHKL